MDEEIGVWESLIDNVLGIVGVLLVIWAVVFVCVGVCQQASAHRDDGPTPSNDN